MPAAPYFLFGMYFTGAPGTCPGPSAINYSSGQTKTRRAEARRAFAGAENQDAAARGARLRELRWKNSAWLATAETIAGWNGLEIRNAGSGRSPVRKSSGYAVMKTTGTSKTFSSSLTA